MKLKKSLNGKMIIMVVLALLFTLSSVSVFAEETSIVIPETNIVGEEMITDEVESSRTFKQPNSNKRDKDVIVNEFSALSIGTTFVVQPYVYASENRIKYNTSWLTSDNYNCPTPVTASSSSSKSVTLSAGLSGSSDITVSDAISAGISATSSYEETSTVSIGNGFTTPGWTKKGMRAYIRYENQSIKAKVRIYMPSIPVGYYIEKWVYSTNIRVVEDGQKYKEYVNAAQVYTSNVPVFPSSWVE